MASFNNPRKVSSLTNEEKQQLTRFVFPKMEASEFGWAWPSIDQCFSKDAGKDHQLKFAQYLRGAQWLRLHGFIVPEEMPVAIAEN